MHQTLKIGIQVFSLIVDGEHITLQPNTTK